MLALLVQLQKKYKYTFDRFLEEEDDKSKTEGEIRAMWKQMMFGTLFIKLDAAKEYKKM